MRRIGEVVRTAGGVAVARSPDADHPEIGETVVDEELNSVGRVVDVMGPADRPYVVITTEGQPAALLNSRVYVR